MSETRHCPTNKPMVVTLVATATTSKLRWRDSHSPLPRANIVGLANQSSSMIIPPFHLLVVPPGGVAQVQAQAQARSSALGVRIASMHDPVCERVERRVRLEVGHG